MRKLVCWILASGCLAHSVLASDKESQFSNEICNKAYRLFSPDGKELGTYSIKAVENAPKSEIEIAESAAMDYRGKKAEMKSTVIYGTKPSLSPIIGTTETKIDGKICMKGTVTFSDKTVDIECKGYLDKRTGEEIDPPSNLVKKEHPVEDGVLIFQSALPTLGPRLLPKEGELKDVVFIEFPDDLGAPELINFKSGFRLVRGKANGKGEYDLKIYSPHHEDSISQIRFNKDDQIVSISAFGKLKFVEVDKEEN